MNMIDVINTKRKYNEEIEQSWQMLNEVAKQYDDKRGALIAIRETKGFKEIVKFWESQIDIATRRLRGKPKVEEVSELLVKIDQANKFVEWCQNLTKS